MQDRLAKVPKAAIRVMDHATVHQRHDLIQALQDNACTLESLPLIVLGQTPLSINGLNLKPLENGTGALLMSYFLFITKLPHYIDLAIECVIA